MKYRDLKLTFTIADTKFDVISISQEKIIKPYPRHAHSKNSYELHFITEGRGTLIINNQKYDITPDTLRYYERVGVIPEVSRTKGGIRDFTDEDIKWVENAICMRSAGVPVEMLIEYVKLFQEGDSTIEARRNLLAEARVTVQENLDKYQATMDRLNYKISRYSYSYIE